MDELALVKRLKESDSTAFVQLYHQYHHPLYIFILRFVKIPGTAEDILQDVFLKIWEIRDRINPELSFNAYLYRISRNAVFKLLKKAANDSIMQAEILQQLGENAEAPHILLQWKQYHNILQQAISHLPPQRQNVFRLCREEGKTYDEAASQLGISKNTVKEHMVSAMKSIKEYISSHAEISLSLLFLLLQKNNW